MVPIRRLTFVIAPHVPRRFRPKKVKGSSKYAQLMLAGAIDRDVFDIRRIIFTMADLITTPHRAYDCLCKANLVCNYDMMFNILSSYIPLIKEERAAISAILAAPRCYTKMVNRIISGLNIDWTTSTVLLHELFYTRYYSDQNRLDRFILASGRWRPIHLSTLVRHARLIIKALMTNLTLRCTAETTGLNRTSDQLVILHAIGDRTKEPSRALEAMLLDCLTWSCGSTSLAIYLTNMFTYDIRAFTAVVTTHTHPSHPAVQAMLRILTKRPAFVQAMADDGCYSAMYHSWAAWKGVPSAYLALAYMNKIWDKDHHCYIAPPCKKVRQMWSRNYGRGIMNDAIKNPEVFRRIVGIPLVHFAIRCAPWFCVSDKMNYFERDDNGYNAFYAVLQCNIANPSRHMSTLATMGVNIRDIDGNGSDACQVYFNMEFGKDYCVRNTADREWMTRTFKTLGLDIWSPVRDGQTPEQLIYSERDYDVEGARDANNMINYNTSLEIISRRQLFARG